MQKAWIIGSVEKLALSSKLNPVSEESSDGRRISTTSQPTENEEAALRPCVFSADLGTD
jgi:hypothetical protein